MRTPASQRFYALVARDPKTGCWLWQGAVDKKTGYGVFNAGDDRTIKAHVFAFDLAYPGIRAAHPGMVVRHNCDTKLCVNPKCLRGGTQKNNVADMDRRGRRVNNPRRGDDHPMSKLTRQQVTAARELWHDRRATTAELARMYGVSRTTMSDALRERSWR